MNTDTNKEIPAKSLQPTIWSVWMNESVIEIDRNRAREMERDRQPSAHTAKIHRDIALAANRKPFITYNVHTFPKFIVFWFFQIKTNWNVVKFIDHRANTMNMAPGERYGMAQFFSLPFICTIRTYRSIRQRYISVRRILFSYSFSRFPPTPFSYSSKTQKIRSFTLPRLPIYFLCDCVCCWLPMCILLV